MLDESFKRHRRSRTGDEQIEIADGFLPPAQASGGADFFESFAFGQIGHQLVSHALAEVEQEPSRALSVLRDGTQHFLFELGAHARQLAQFLFAADALQVVDGRDLEMLVEQRDALRAEPLDLQQLEP